MLLCRREREGPDIPKGLALGTWPSLGGREARLWCQRPAIDCGFGLCLVSDRFVLPRGGDTLSCLVAAAQFSVEGPAFAFARGEAHGEVDGVLAGAKLRLESWTTVDFTLRHSHRRDIVVAAYVELSEFVSVTCQNRTTIAPFLDNTCPISNHSTSRRLSDLGPTPCPTPTPCRVLSQTNCVRHRQLTILTVADR